jgi:hypothetical protein
MLGGTVLDRVSSINDLGVIMNEKMTFSEHVDVMVAKGFAMLHSKFISTVSHLNSTVFALVTRRLKE